MLLLKVPCKLYEMYRNILWLKLNIMPVKLIIDYSKKNKKITWQNSNCSLVLQFLPLVRAIRQVNFSPPGLCYKCLTILYWCILQECLTMDSASDLILSLFKISLLNQCKVKGRLLYHTYVSPWFQYYITVKDYLIASSIA